jgi:hypothetical protein
MAPTNEGLVDVGVVINEKLQSPRKTSFICKPAEASTVAFAALNASPFPSITRSTEYALPASYEPVAGLRLIVALAA